MTELIRKWIDGATLSAGIVVEDAEKDTRSERKTKGSAEESGNSRLTGSDSYTTGILFT